jgi:glycosyltransferase involved in cell wall biosynthesis
VRIIHLNSSDRGGGASRACIDINDALKSIGVDSSLLVHQKLSDRRDINTTTNTIFQKFVFNIRYWLDYLLIRFLSIKERGRFSFPFCGLNITEHPLIKQADIIHLHWINQGFFSIKTFQQLSKFNKPIVWTLHDMWAFTGGCHYSSGCKKYSTECENCPSLKFSSENDFSHKVFKEKSRVFKNLNINIITCSKWLAKETKESFLFQNEKIITIPNPIDTDIYSPNDQYIAREKLNLPKDKILILFGTMTLSEKRKGFDYLRDALLILEKNNPDLKEKIELFVFGSSKAKSFDTIPFKTNFLGRIPNVSKLVQCYNAADVFVAPSLEDNLPNTVMESLSCGTPVVAFNIGGMPDMVEHKVNGYLAEPQNKISLANGIMWVIENNNKEILSLNARKKITKNFTPEIVANLYMNFYKSLI